jgi:hypothetical protein
MATTGNNEAGKQWKPVCTGKDEGNYGTGNEGNYE